MHTQSSSPLHLINYLDMHQYIWWVYIYHFQIGVTTFSALWSHKETHTGAGKALRLGSTNWDTWEIHTLKNDSCAGKLGWAPSGPRSLRSRVRPPGMQRWLLAFVCSVSHPPAGNCLPTVTSLHCLLDPLDHIIQAGKSIRNKCHSERHGEDRGATPSRVRQGGEARMPTRWCAETGDVHKEPLHLAGD